MQKLFIPFLGMLFTAIGLPVNAALIVSNIDLEVRATSYSYLGVDDVAAATSAFNAGNLVGKTSLSAVDQIGARQSFGRTRDYGQLISIDMSFDSSTLFELGTDWGRGGIIFTSFGSLDVLGDTWWNNDWTNPDVISFSGPSFSGTLNLLGFEGCCGGNTSMRYSEDNGNTWNIVAVNAVPEPSVIALFAAGLFGLGFTYRRRHA